VRIVLIACSLSLVVASQTARAQGAAAPEARQPPPKAGGKTAASEASGDLVKRGSDYFAQCMNDWEPATHMTKTEWQRTCRRVAQERLKFLQDQARKDGKM
jgi:hypothetical protein